MKIGLVSLEFPPFFGGGIGTYTTILGRSLVRAGHAVSVVSNAWADLAGSPPSEPPRPDDPTVYRIDALTSDYRPRPPFDRPDHLLGGVGAHWGSALLWSILVSEKLEEIHQAQGLDVVEFPESFGAGYHAIRRRMSGLGRLDVPLTVTLHLPTHELSTYNLFPKTIDWVQRLVTMEDYGIRNADAVSCPSRALADVVSARLGLDPGRQPIDVVPNPIEIGAVPGPAGVPAAGGRPSLLFVGRLEPRKGPRLLVDAAVRVLSDIPDLTIEMIGADCAAGEVPGSMTDFLRSRIPDALQSRFVFAGRLPRAEVLGRYREASACVFPAPFDNFPYTCGEAMASGGCVVASDGGGTAEMVEHERSGLLFSAGDVHGLEVALRRVLCEPGLEARLRAQAPRRVRDLSEPGTVVGKRIDFYARTIDRYRSRSRPTLAAAAPSRVAVFVRAGDDLLVDATIESVSASGRRAGVTLDVRREGPETRPAGPTETTPHGRGLAPGAAHTLAAWLDHVRESKPDFLLTLAPGDLVDVGYLETTVRSLAASPKAAWATTWIRSGSGGAPYAGFDFSLPLDLGQHHPVPLALVRGAAFHEVGGWNLSLPAGWREWDLWLAFAQAGWAGLVAPVWEASARRTSPRWLEDPPDDATRASLRESIVGRNRRLFAENVEALWISQVPGPRPQAGPVPSTRERGALRSFGPRVWHALRRRISRLSGRGPLDKEQA